MANFTTFHPNTPTPTACPLNATVCRGTSCLDLTGNSFNEILSLAMGIVLTVLLAMVMFAMGCNVELARLWCHIRRPWGIVVGILCQFGIMPLTGFSLALAFDVMPVQAVVILIMGCCPGGSSSNILTFWLDGDMDLSVSMTTCSSILAMGMMPLCLLIYSSTWTSADAIQIPYDSIGITLVSLLIPVSLGMYVKHRWPKTSKKILKVGSVLGFLLIVVIAVVGGVLYQSSWVISPALWIIGAIFPLLGFSLGFLLARLVGQPWERCRTIALETGFQNTQLCSTIVQLSFSAEDLEVMFSFPLIYSIFQIVMVILVVGGYRLYKWRVAQKAADSSEKQAYTMENGGFQHDMNSLPGGKFTQL